jgi:lysophospholipase L1-like esterase
MQDVSSPRDRAVPQKRRSWASARHLRTWLGAALTFLAAAELTARFDDYLFNDISPLASPDRERDLLVQMPWGTRGKPNGHFRKWHLNEYGFLGPSMSQLPTGTRVMVLGASETFGLYESAGQNYPAQLSKDLAERGRRDVEIVNAAVAGMTLPSLKVYWDNWASAFQPSFVLLYPAAHFYLDNERPRVAPKSAITDGSVVSRLVTSSRFVERIVDQGRQMQLLRALRSQLEIGRALKGKSPDYLFVAINLPQDRLHAFTRDLEDLGEAVARTGAKPVLITPAFKTPSPPAPSDLAELSYFRIFIPRAEPDAIPAFVAAARQAIIDLGQRRGWPVIDAAYELGGCRELFADPVHFTNEGSRRLAHLIGDRLLPMLGTGAGGY